MSAAGHRAWQWDESFQGGAQAAAMAFEAGWLAKCRCCRGWLRPDDGTLHGGGDGSSWPRPLLEVVLRAGFETEMSKFLCPVMSHPGENIRLRVSLSASTKFYISVRKEAELSELNAVITDVLLKAYGCKLVSFAVRSDDGYEILPYFRVGEVLSDNQLLCIDTMPLGRFARDEPAPVPCAVGDSSRGQRPVSSQETGPSRSEPGTDTGKNILSFYKSNESYLRQKDENVQLQNLSSKKKAQKRVDDGGAKPDPEAQGRNGASGKDAKIEKTQDSDVKVAVLDSAPAKVPAVLDPQSPQFDSKFKGFAVKKKDLEKSKAMNFSASTMFKPLKKRKQEEIFEPI